jgi:hypothetical protein
MKVWYQLVAHCFYLPLIIAATCFGHLGGSKFIDIYILCVSLCGRDEFICVT